jgi:uncharacterized protein with HEPN domain
MSPADRTALLQIRIACFRIASYTVGMSLADFMSDDLRRSAVMYQIMVMGEAVKRLSTAFRQRYDGVNWRAVAGMRDILIHKFDTIDVSRVWNSAVRDSPDLDAAVSRMLLSA